MREILEQLQVQLFLKRQFLQTLQEKVDEEERALAAMQAVELAT